MEYSQQLCIKQESSNFLNPHYSKKHRILRHICKSLTFILNNFITNYFFFPTGNEKFDHDNVQPVNSGHQPANTTKPPTYVYTYSIESSFTQTVDKDPITVRY